MITDKLLIKKLTFPPLDEREALRYAGIRVATDEHISLIRSSLDELSLYLQNVVIYKILKVSTGGGVCNFGSFSVRSEKLANELVDAEYAAIICATLGVGVDRIIAKYSRTSPSRAHIVNAVATERIEALLDEFETKLKRDVSKEKYELCSRFSPGYGDFALTEQKNIFNLLTPNKYIGLTLNNSLIMSPSKSVSAIIGIKKRKPK